MSDDVRAGGAGLPPADARAATRYHRLQLALSAADLGLAVAFLAAAQQSGAARAVAAAVHSGWPSLQVAAVAAALGVAAGALAFPLALVRGWWLPRRFGLLHQRLGPWLLDRLKGAALGGALGLVAVEVVYGLLRVSDSWWLIASAVFAVAYVVIAMVVPVWVLPLFYRLAPLYDAPLAGRLLDLARRAGVPAVGVWVADQSRRSRTANAMLTGLGRTRRIVLFDTLVSRFTPAEVESVLAHELAHHVHRDHARGLAVQGVLTLVTLGLADGALRVGARWLGLAGPADPAGLPWLALVLLGLGLLAAPLTNGFSRWIERQADDFAVAITADPHAFIGAMERLAQLNLAERRPHRLVEILFYSHPSIDRRIARARATSSLGPARSPA
jgi:STE24 endopeptidase